MILTAIAFRPQSPYPLHQRLFPWPSGGRYKFPALRVSGARIAAQVRIRKKVRTVRPLHLSSSEYAHIRALFRSVKHTNQAASGVEQIVMIYQRYPVALRHGQRTIRVPGNAKVFRAELYANARVAGQLAPSALRGCPRVDCIRRTNRPLPRTSVVCASRESTGAASSAGSVLSVGIKKDRRWGRGGTVLTLARCRRVRLLRHKPRAVARFVPRTCGAMRLLCIAGLKNSEFCIGIMRLRPAVPRGVPAPLRFVPCSSAT